MECLNTFMAEYHRPEVKEAEVLLILEGNRVVTVYVEQGDLQFFLDTVVKNKAQVVDAIIR